MTIIPFGRIKFQFKKFFLIVERWFSIIGSYKHIVKSLKWLYLKYLCETNVQQ